MKKHPLYFSLVIMLISVLIGCEKEASGNFGTYGVERHLSVASVAEYDSLGIILLNEYEFKIVEEKDTFWRRYHLVKDTIAVKYDTTYVSEDSKEILKIDTIYKLGDEYRKYYNDMTKKCRYLRLDTIRMKYADKYTELRFTFNSNGRWKASEIAFADSTKQSAWAFPINQYGGGKSMLRMNCKFGLIGTIPRFPVIQNAYTPDSLIYIRFNVLRKGLKAL